MQMAIAEWLERGETHVLACSALKDSYRNILRVDDNAVVFVYLDAPRELIEARLAARQHHYMKLDMVESQFATLEAPDDGQAIVVDARKNPEAIVEEVIRSVPDCEKSTRRP
jgi:gluconokinase